MRIKVVAVILLLILGVSCSDNKVVHIHKHIYDDIGEKCTPLCGLLGEYKYGGAFISNEPTVCICKLVSGQSKWFKYIDIPKEIL
jgi:hypothetical protein